MDDLEPQKEEVGTYDIIIPKVYKDLFIESDIKRYILASGRISGKTSVLVELLYITINAYPQFDIVVLQATAAEIKDSIINEIRQFYENKGFDVGDKPSSQIYIPKSNEFVQINDGKTKGKIFFYPITDSKGGQRTRGIKTENPVSLILFEEVQKNRDSNVVDQAIATFVRQGVDKAKYPSFTGTKFVCAGNNETEGHWFTEWCKTKKKDPTWKVIYANCYDIWGLLNQDTKDYILAYKKSNYKEYRRMFLGDIKATTDDYVFPQFVREKDYLLPQKMLDTIGTHRIVRLMLGIDHATANDKFVACPVAILDNGTCEILDCLVDDPKETGRSISPAEQCAMLDRYLENMEDKYGFARFQTPISMSVDGAAAPFIAELRHTKRTSPNREIWNNIKIFSFTKKKKDFNVHIIQDAFAYGVVKILNTGRYDIMGNLNKHYLVHEIQALKWKNGKLDPSIPNDCTDAFEYGLVPYYTNCYNLSFPIRASGENHLSEIKKMMYMRL